jgi:two-component system, LuxR family, response regulator FixJ
MDGPSSSKAIFDQAAKKLGCQRTISMTTMIMGSVSPMRRRHLRKMRPPRPFGIEMNIEPIAYIVDDDPALRDALCMLLESVEIKARAFARAEDLLSSGLLKEIRPACLLADVRMPGISGIALLERLHDDGIAIPTILITGYGDIPMAVRAMKLGAIDFITKPVNHQALLDLVQDTLRDYSGPSDQDAQADALMQRFRALTPREQQVFQCITAGQSNRAVAEELGISVRTAEFHRARIMKKMQTHNLADLTLARVTIADRLVAHGK